MPPAARGKAGGAFEAVGDAVLTSVGADLAVAALACRRHRSDHPRQGLLQARPARGGKDHDGQVAVVEVLLVLEVLVRRDEHLKPCRLGRGDEFAILQAGPAALVRCFYNMTGKRMAQWGWRALVKKNKHSRHRQSAARGMLQHGSRLLDRNAREPLDELVQRSVVFEVLEQRCDGHARAPEHPCAAEDGGVLLYRAASGPVNHENDGSTDLSRVDAAPNAALGGQRRRAQWRASSVATSTKKP